MTKNIFYNIILGMKTVLTIVVCNGMDNVSSTLYDGIELKYPEEGETEINFLTRAFKNAKGKYSLVCVDKFRFADVRPLLNILDKNTSDIVNFMGGSVIKTSVFRDVVKDCPDAFSVCALAVMASKTMLKTTYVPFVFEKDATTFSDCNTEGLLLAAAEFKKMKPKLTKEIYTYIFDLLCSRIIIFYIYAMLSIKDGRLDADKLIEFDNRLKAEIVLYLAIDKRFTYANLQKLRNRGFKISYFTAKKFRKVIKCN